jgi:uncharacterized protein (DUF1810 family)
MADSEFQHFVEAQRAVYDQVVAELSQGQKRSHWMWFIFPQIQGLGHSEMAQRFALDSVAQARRYANHPVLGTRLRQCTQLVVQVEGRKVSEIFGYPDDLKFHSSTTLFELAAPEENLFRKVNVKFFGGRQDAKTLEILGLKEK